MYTKETTVVDLTISLMQIELPQVRLNKGLLRLRINKGQRPNSEIDQVHSLQLVKIWTDPIKVEARARVIAAVQDRVVPWEEAVAEEDRLSILISRSKRHRIRSRDLFKGPVEIRQAFKTAWKTGLGDIPTGKKQFLRLIHSVVIYKLGKSQLGHMFKITTESRLR